MKKITVLEAIREAISEEMDRDADVFMIGEDIGRFGSALGMRPIADIMFTDF